MFLGGTPNQRALSPGTNPAPEPASLPRNGRSESAAIAENSLLSDAHIDEMVIGVPELAGSQTARLPFFRKTNLGSRRKQTIGSGSFNKSNPTPCSLRSLWLSLQAARRNEAREIGWAGFSRRGTMGKFVLKVISGLLAEQPVFPEPSKICSASAVASA